MGYKTFEIKPFAHELQKGPKIALGNVLENSNLKATVNSNGTVDVLYKKTGRVYKGLNFYTSQGEVGNAWAHTAPEFDRKYTTIGENHKIYVVQSGELSGTIVTECEFEIPESCAVNPSDIYVKLPIKTEYTLDKDADYIKVKTTINNTAKDHWLRVNFPTGIETDVSYTDSHFDVLTHDIAVADSTDWVEQAFGTQPLRTFAELTDGKDGFAVMPKGLFEYEVFEDRTMALTLLRACRIKLAVSEEKVTELEDEGVECPGKHTFEYAMHFNQGDVSELPNCAAEIFTPVKCAVCGRGKGDLPLENSMIEIDNPNIHVTAIKQAEDGDGVMIRYYNPTDQVQPVSIKTNKELYICRMDESVIEKIANPYRAEPKKIITIRMK